jgi:glutathione S-transferase
MSPRDRAQALWVEEYCDGNIAPNVITLFQQKVLGPAVRKTTPDQAVIDNVANVLLPPQFDYVESLLSGDYFVGNNLSIADITIASNLLIYHYLGFRPNAQRYPKLNAHFVRMLRRPSFQTALQAEEAGVKNFGLDKRFLQGIYPQQAA